MKKNEVQIGGVYSAKVNDRVVHVRIDAENRSGGWDATNLATKKKVRIKTAQRLREKIGGPVGQPATPNEPAAPEPETPAVAPEAKKTRKAKQADAADGNGKKMGCLDAAAQVLASASEPMNAKEMIAAITEAGLWTSPGGKTPHATLYSAIIREIAVKGADARFRKTERGKFTAQNAA